MSDVGVKTSINQINVSTQKKVLEISSVKNKISAILKRPQINVETKTNKIYITTNIATTTFGNKTTDDLREGNNNRYYTDERVSNNPDVLANTSDRHTHQNKNLLDSLIDNGSGNNFLADDGTYKEVSTADEKVKASSTDTVAGYLSDKVDNQTIEVSNNKLKVKNGVFGNVTNPSSSTDLDIAVFDGTTGKLIKDGGKTIAQIEAEIPNNTDNLPEGTTNLYYKDSRVSSNQDVSANTSARHTHSNKALLDNLTNTGSGDNFLADDGTYKTVGTADEKVKASSTDTTAGYLDAKVDGSTIEVSSNKLKVKDNVFADKVHTHTASDITDFDTKVSNNSDVSSNTSARHTHANKALLDTYDQTNADLADAVSKKHTHSNKSILDATEESFTTALKGNYDTAYSHSQLTSGNPHNVTKADVGLGNVTNDAQIPLSQKGVAGGVAELDSNGIVPSSQLPSYVDDVLEYDTQSDFPATGETGKIYVAKDTNKTYRWGGSSYVEISASLALGETSDTAYRGDRGKIAYDHSQLTSGNPHQVTLSDVGGTTDHTQLTNIGTNTHAQIDDHISSTANPHSVTASQVGAYSTSETDNLLSGKEDKSNKVTSFQATPDDTHYPSEKLVKDSLDGKSNVGHTHTSSDITDLTSTLDPRYVNVSGDTMTGLLTLSGDPSNNLHAATKQYVDNIRDIDGGTFFDTYIATNDVDGGIF